MTKALKASNRQQLAWEEQVSCFVCSASVQVWKHWKPRPGVRRAELVWSLFIYPSFNLNSMFEMRPAMLLSAVVLWLKWEKPFYLFLSPRQWPLFCVQMLQCVDNIPVGFGGGLSQRWWHFDPPPHLILTSRVAFRMYCCLAEEPLCRPSDSCSGSWIINPLTLPPQEPTFASFFCAFWLIGEPVNKETSVRESSPCLDFLLHANLHLHSPSSALWSDLSVE